SRGINGSSVSWIAEIDAIFPGQPELLQSIEDYAIYAAVLYELREVDFATMSKDDVRIQIKRSMEHEESDQLDQKEDLGSDPKPKASETSDPGRLDGDKVDPRWIHAHRAFETLKSKIASTPILPLVQEYDQIYYPITFVSRTLKSNELNYSPVEKEVLALLRILDLGYNMLVGRRIRVLTRYSTLAWLFRSTGLQGRLGQWTSLLSPWTLEIVKCVKGEEEILGVITASITSRSMVDEALIQISPKKEPRRKIQTPIPVIQADEELYVVSFDGSARMKRGGGAYSAILWKLPEWTVIQARSAYAEDLTVNEAEYHGLLLCLDLLSTVDRKRVVFCGDSNLVIRQVRGEIECKAPGLTLLKQRALDRLRDWPDHELVHAKRDWNGSADSLASAALQRQGGVKIESDEEKQDLITLNRLDEVLVVKRTDQVAQITVVVTRSGSRSTTRTTSDPRSLREEIVRDLRIDRIRQAQDEEAWISGLKKYLNGDLQDLTQQEAESYANLAADYDLDHNDLLFYCPSTRPTDADRDKLMRLVIPETLYQDTGKSKPRIQGESSGNLQATYPFQIIAMDHIPSLPRSHKGNTELLIFEDLFSGYVIAKASSSRTAQTVAESYEECVFRRFGASEAIRHDREPGFMSDFFRAFNKILDGCEALEGSSVFVTEGISLTNHFAQISGKRTDLSLILSNVALSGDLIKIGLGGAPGWKIRLFCIFPTPIQIVISLLKIQDLSAGLCHLGREMTDRGFQTASILAQIIDMRFQLMDLVGSTISASRAEISGAGCGGSRPMMRSDSKDD
ncbi:reverse transcriptase, partial [Phytophthora palmivora]